MPPTKEEVRSIARCTINIIKSNITTNVCLFGSAGTALWTNIGRVPNVRRATQICLSILFRLKRLVFKIQDIDIVVSNEYWGHFDEEDIKYRIEVADHRYFRERSGLPEATYNILYCRLPGWKNDHGRRVKIDVLVPPTIGLPNIMYSEAILIKGIPVMPIFDLLAMKAVGWWERRNSDRKDFNAKAKNDVRDILALLERAKKEGVLYVNEANEYRHTSEFMGRARTLLDSFVSLHGGGQQWRAIKSPVGRTLSPGQSGSAHGSAHSISQSGHSSTSWTPCYCSYNCFCYSYNIPPPVFTYSNPLLSPVPMTTDSCYFTYM